MGKRMRRYAVRLSLQDTVPTRRSQAPEVAALFVHLVQKVLDAHYHGINVERVTCHEEGTTGRPRVAHGLPRPERERLEARVRYVRKLLDRADRTGPAH